jgi:hypothetical protein
MNKYLVFICFGILLFILWNKIDKFNISSQFTLPTDTDFTDYYTCPREMACPLADRIIAGGPCVMYQILNFLYFTNNRDEHEVDFYITEDDVLRNALDTYYDSEENFEPGWQNDRRQQILQNLPRNLLNTFDMLPVYNTIAFIVPREEINTWSEEEEMAYGYDIALYGSNENLKEHIKVGKLYIASLFINFKVNPDNPDEWPVEVTLQKTGDVGAEYFQCTVPCTQPRPNKILVQPGGVVTFNMPDGENVMQVDANNVEISDADSAADMGEDGAVYGFPVEGEFYFISVQDAEDPALRGQNARIKVVVLYPPPLNANHAILLYRTPNSIKVINGGSPNPNRTGYCTGSDSSYMPTISTHVDTIDTPEYTSVWADTDIINTIRRLFLDRRYAIHPNGRKYTYKDVKSTHLKIFKFKSKTNNDCAVTVDDDVETTGA